MSGTLYVVATPIGNLEDLSFRALRILKEVDLVAAEDTRRTSKLLAHYQVQKPLVSVREHNEVREVPRLLSRLTNGESIALVTDAGTPGISDPGAKLVRAVRDAGLRVVPIPGASAVTAALSVSGMSGDEFAFMGFPPRGGTARTDWFERLKAELRVVVFFEAPHRITRTIGQITESTGGRRVIVFREITKIHESDITIAVHPAASPPITDRGEFVVVVDSAARPDVPVPDAPTVIDWFGRLTDTAGLDRAVAADMLASFLGTNAQTIRKIVKQGRILVNRHNQASP